MNHSMAEGGDHQQRNWTYLAVIWIGRWAQIPYLRLVSFVLVPFTEFQRHSGLEIGPSCISIAHQLHVTILQELAAFVKT